MDRAKLAKIHIAKKELALTDDAYRDILRLHFQAESAKELNDRQGTALINLFRAKGWAPSPRPAKAQRAPRPRRDSHYIDIPEGGPAAQQQRMVAGLWNELGYPMAALHSRVKRQFKVERLQWLTDHDSLHVLITDVEARLERQRRKENTTKRRA